MAGRGRPKKPPELKILEGTYRKDRDGPLPPDTAAGEPKPPAHLKKEGLAFWKYVAPGLIAAGVAKERDAAALAMMCEWWARYRRFSEQLDKPAKRAAYFETKEQYQLTVMVGIAWQNFDKIAARFGMTPSDRAKLRLGNDGPKKPAVTSRARA